MPLASTDVEAAQANRAGIELQVVVGGLRREQKALDEAGRALERVTGEGHIVCGHCRHCRAGLRHLCSATVGVGGVMGLQLVAMWVPRIATGLSGDLAGAGLMGTPTLAVQALDLGIIVPLALATAVFAWQRKPVGYLLAAVFSIKGVTMSGAIVAMLISAWIVEGRLDVAPFALFSIATAVAGTIAFFILRSIRSGEAAA